jgi:hypothetical protein
MTAELMFSWSCWLMGFYPKSVFCCWEKRKIAVGCETVKQISDTRWLKFILSGFPVFARMMRARGTFQVLKCASYAKIMLKSS